MGRKRPCQCAGVSLDAVLIVTALAYCGGHATASPMHPRTVWHLILAGVVIATLLLVANTTLNGVTLHEVEELESRVRRLSSATPSPSTLPEVLNEARPASPSSAPKVDPATAARNSIRTLIDAYRSAKSAGNVHTPSQNDLRRFLKQYGSPVNPDLQPVDVGSSDSAGPYWSEYYSQRANSLGLSKRDERTATPADYDHDFDGDGVPDFAVVHLEPYMVVPPQPPQPFALQSGMYFTWTPTTLPSDYTLVRQPNTALISTAGHAVLPLGDDDNTHVFIAHAFPFNGTAWTDFYVNSDGSITFGSSSSLSTGRNLGRVFSSPPMITPLLTDLDNTCSVPGNGIFFFSSLTQTIITWKAVPHFARSGTSCGVLTGNENTFQIVLFPSGLFEFRYGSMDVVTLTSGASGTDSVTAVTRGPGQYSPATYVDFPTLTSVAVQLGTVAEYWSALGVDFQSIALDQGVAKFYATHGDLYDAVLNMHVGFGVVLDTLVDGNGGNFNRRALQRTLGLGERGGYSSAPSYGNKVEVESVINLRNLERLRGMSETDMREGVYAKMANFMWRDNTKQGFPTSMIFGSVGGVNFTGYPWEVNLTGYTPVNSPAAPFFIDLTANGASSGYTHELQGPAGGARMSVVPSGGSIFQVAMHELMHRWLFKSGLRYPDSSAYADHFFDLASRGAAGVGGVHPGTLTDIRVQTTPAQNPWADKDATFLPKRPRGDPMSYSAGHLTQLVPKPGDPSRFIDPLDPSAVYPDTKTFDMAIADELCRAQGLDLFVSTPQARWGGMSSRSLAFAGILPLNESSVRGIENFYVDSPRSPYGALGFDFDLRQVSGLQGLAVQNLLFCGKRQRYTVADMTNLEDVRLDPATMAFLGPMTGPTTSQPILAQLYYGNRAPLIGDEADSVDSAVLAQYPQLYSQYNLASCPLVSDATCNGGPFSRYGNMCVDIKTVAPVLLAAPGYTPTNQDLQLFGKLITVLRRDLAKYGLQSHGARGMEGDMCYLPKFSFGIPQLIH